MNYLEILISILAGLAIVVLINVLLEFIAGLASAKNEKKNKNILLQIRVTRDIETGPIIAEQIFSTIHGIVKKLSFWDRIRGINQEKLSFEIANVGGRISFFIYFPSKLRNLVEGQIYAQYPNVEITEVQDYSSLNRPDFDINSAMSMELGLQTADIFPIKRYPQFEDKKAKYPIDPLAAVTSSISKLNNLGDNAWIQIVVRPMEDKWRLVFTRCIKILNKGVFFGIGFLQNYYTKLYCTRNRVLRIILFPLYWSFTIAGIKAGASKLDDANGGSAGIVEAMSVNHDKETPLSAAMDKAGRLLYEANIRMVYLPKVANNEVSIIKLKEITGAFKQYNLSHLNGFIVKEVLQGFEAVDRYKNRVLKDSFVLNSEELATIFHLPNVTVTTPNIYWVKSRRLEPPADLPDANDPDITVLGATNFRGTGVKFGIKPLDRRRHMYIIGKTGMGKSTLLENMIFSDIRAGRGVAVVDPHGDLADAVINFVPSNRTNDVIVFDPSDRDYPVSFNMLENVDSSLNTIVCSGLVGIFKKIYAESWGPRLEHILRNTILSLLEYPGTTMLGIPRILQDQDFRRKVVKKISDPIVRAFWDKEFEKLDSRQRTEAISPILNKVGQFLSSPIIRNILGQTKSSLDLRFAMDKKKIVVINLSKGKIGEDNSALLGSMIITKFQIDAMSRANIPEKDRTDFYLYVDEFQNFATDSFATILSEARKYKLNLTMANQYIAQMNDEVKGAVFGNVGTVVSFQVGFDDAEYLSNQFGEEVLPADLVSLSRYTAYSRLLIDGMPSNTFSFDTLPPPQLNVEEGRREKVIKLSRERYAKSREVVEDKIMRWSSSEGGREQNK